MLLITGASGQLGQRVLHHLIDTLKVSPQQIVAASRDPSKLNAWKQRGVHTRALDFDTPDTFASAFADVERALLISTDALDRPGLRLRQHQTAVTALAQARVQHVVYTSMPQPHGSPLLIAPDHEGTEKALADSTLPGWTVLRNHWYFENNFLFLPPAIASGTWYAADGGQGSADISRDDLARAAAVVLASTRSGKQTFTLSGPQALTKADIAREVGAAIGKPIQVMQVPLEALVQGMVSAGVPETLARVFASFDTNTAAGRVAEVTNDFRAITGAAPQSFTQWVAEHKGQLAA